MYERPLSFNKLLLFSICMSEWGSCRVVVVDWSSKSGVGWGGVGETTGNAGHSSCAGEVLMRLSSEVTIDLRAEVVLQAAVCWA